MGENKLHPTGTGSAQLVCRCKSPTRKCDHAKEKVNGYYCELELDPTSEIQARQLRSGDRFSFKEAPWLIHTVVGNFGDYVKYRKECGWLLNIDDLNRVVNKVL